MAAAWLAITGDGVAQVAAPPTPPIEAPQDTPYPGVIGLKVDATDLAHGIFAVSETLPLAVEGGPLTLLYPKWIPGVHAPGGTIDKLAGLVITADGQRVAWRRDPSEVTAFHVIPPARAKTLNLSFQYLSAVSTREGHVEMTPDMLDLEWNSVILYPAGHYARDIMVAPSVVLPAGFTAATALEPGASADSFKPVALDTLGDSPVMAGRYFKHYDLDASRRSPVRLDVMADPAVRAGTDGRRASRSRQSCRPSRSAIRSPALCSLRLPGLAQRQARRGRAGASSVERRRNQCDLLPGLGDFAGRS